MKKTTTAKPLIVKTSKKINYKLPALNLQHEQPVKGGFTFLDKNITPENHPEIFEHIADIESHLLQMNEKAELVGKAFEDIPYKNVITWCFDVLGYMGHAALKNKMYEPSYDAFRLIKEFYMSVSKEDYEQSPATRGEGIINWLSDYTDNQDDIMCDISNVFFISMSKNGHFGSDEYQYFTPVFNALMTAMNAFHEYKHLEHTKDVYENLINDRLLPYITVNNFIENIKINDKVSIVVHKHQKAA